MVAMVTSCVLLPILAAPLAAADPAVDNPTPPPDVGLVASAAPSIATTPDGWTLDVVAVDESQLPVAPLTTAVTSREYLVAGTFLGTVTGSGSTELTGGTLDVGYQIGCGIELGQVRLIGSVGLGTSGSTLTGGLVPTGLSAPLSTTIEIHPKPGTVTQVSVNKKTFKQAPVRVTIKDIHVKIDGCVGQSFIRSYATLTSSTTDTNDVIAYYGTTKAV